MYYKIKSKNKCPVCGGNEWYPLFRTSMEPMRSIDDVKYLILVMDKCSKDAEIYTDFDQCADCWTVVSG
jgi:rRNA maturation protein Nop10